MHLYNTNTGFSCGWLELAMLQLGQWTRNVIVSHHWDILAKHIGYNNTNNLSALINVSQMVAKIMLNGQVDEYGPSVRASTNIQQTERDAIYKSCCISLSVIIGVLIEHEPAEQHLTM
ncbi:hypothetical protein CBL_09618 [Carabus blaptoides fortunei]